MRSRRLRRLLLWLSFASLALGCGKKDEVIVESAAGKELSEEQIDRDAWALLPPEAVTWAYLDAKALFASEFGDKVLVLLRSRLPLPDSAFEPKRDLERIYAGFYSMQGADFAAVAQGHFDKEALEQALSEREATSSGTPISKTSYAGRVLYTAEGGGFVVLSKRTLLFGNDVGIRRTLDRIKEGRAKRELPEYLEKLLSNPKAAMVMGMDLTSNPLPDAARKEFAFLKGVEMARVLGNFEPPGLNFAGTLRYSDEQAAQEGAVALEETQEMLKAWAPVMAMLGIQQPVEKLEARAEGEEAKFVLEVDGRAVSVLLDKAQVLLPGSEPTGDGAPSSPEAAPGAE